MLAIAHLSIYVRNEWTTEEFSSTQELDYTWNKWGFCIEFFFFYQESFKLAPAGTLGNIIMELNISRNNIRNFHVWIMVFEICGSWMSSFVVVCSYIPFFFF